MQIYSMKKRRILTAGLILSGIHSMIFLPLPAHAQGGTPSSLFSEKASKFEFRNANAVLSLDKATWQIGVKDLNGRVCFSECRQPSFTAGGDTVSALQGPVEIKEAGETVLFTIPATHGKNISLSVSKAGDSGFTVTWDLPGTTVNGVTGAIRLNPVEEIYGFGEAWNGHVAQRGQYIEIWDKGGTPDECAWMPYFVSTNNYAFYLHYGGRVTFDAGRKKADELTYRMLSEGLEYTVILGEDLAGAVKNFVSYTGLPAKPPRWSFKPWSWLMSDPKIPGGPISTLRGEHFLEMLDSLEKLDIPVGVTWFEPPWQDARTTFIPDTAFSPDLKKLIGEMASRGVKTLAWTVPYTSPGASNWDEAVRKGYLEKKPGSDVDNTTLKITESGEVEGTVYNYIDYFNPEAFKWWQDQIKAAADLGLKGFKLDAGQSLVPDGILYGGRTGRDFHNSYAQEYNKVFYGALKQKMGDDFLMIPRAAWIGSGAVTNFKWPGDLSGSFANNGLPSSVYSSLSLAFSGIPFISTDIGGFSDKPAPEYVWTRWAEFGAFLPGMETLHMPWWYSHEAMEHYRYLAWLHTDLIPYWETLANEARRTGAPVCRPLVWNYQDDQETWYVEDEFTVGDYILVAPFMNNERTRDLYLPAGTWYDFWEDHKGTEGGRKISWNKGRREGRWKFPVYIKAGAIIPMEVVNDVSGFGTERSKSMVTLACWPEKKSANRFVLDDREGPVPIVTDWSDPSRLVFTWTGSSADYLFRINIEEPGPLTIRAKDHPLQKFDDRTAFERSSSDAWFYDKVSCKLWIKKFNDRNSGRMEIIWR